MASQLAVISNRLRRIAFSENVSKRIGEEIMAVAADYNAIILKQCAETACLEGRLQECQKQKLGRTSGESFANVVQASGVSRPVAAVLMPTPVPKQQPPQKTFAVVLASAASGDEATSDQVKEKVLTAARSLLMRRTLFWFLLFCFPV